MRRMLMSCIAALAVGLAGCGDCSRVQEDAQALRDEFSRCTAGDTCQKVDFFSVVGSDNCLGVFQCSGALNASANLSAFQQRARTLSEKAQDCGGPCVIASCVDPSQFDAVCNAQLGQCELVLRAP